MGKYTTPRTLAQPGEGIWLSSETWRNDTFRDLGAEAQWLYFLLASHPTLSACSVMPLDIDRWATYAKDMNTGTVASALHGLSQSGLVVLDTLTSEVFVRQLVDGDRLYAPGYNGKRHAWNAIGTIQSETLKAAAIAQTCEIHGDRPFGRRQRIGSTRPFRAFVFQRDSHPLISPGKVSARCFYCGTTITLIWDGSNLKCGPNTHFDHVEPVSRGGADHVDNIVMACRTCNASKNNKTAAEWLERVEAGRTAVKKSKRRAVIATLKGMV